MRVLLKPAGATRTSWGTSELLLKPAGAQGSQESQGAQGPLAAQLNCY